MLDTQGPEIRIGNLPKEVELKAGDTLKLSIDSACDEKEIGCSVATVNYVGLLRDVKKGDSILIDDGMIGLKVMSIDKYSARCMVMNPGKLSSKKCVNLPGVRVNLPSVTEKDISDIKMGITEGVDFIALSFVRHPDDVLYVRKFLEKRRSTIQLISKIEDPEGLIHIDAIIKMSDAIMIARGDLGVELPFEEVPIIQKKIAIKCIRSGKPVIVATHLLDSMIKFPRPTRAEVADVATAVYECVDSLMLSGETTTGNYPLESVKTLDKIARRVEKEVIAFYDNDGKAVNVKEEITRNACINSERLDAKAIIVFTKSGNLANLVNKHRPSTNIYVFTENLQNCHTLMLLWGTLVFKADFSVYESMVENGLNYLVDNGFVEKDKLVVIISDVNPHGENIETMEVRRV